MLIAISASAPSLGAEIDPRFGRCPYFVIVDPETMSYKAVCNESAAAGGGAGIQAARTVADNHALAVLTGNCGPNAHRTLTAGGIQVFTGCSGTVRDVAEAFRRGDRTAAGHPNVGAHHAAPVDRAEPQTGTDPK